MGGPSTLERNRENSRFLFGLKDNTISKVRKLQLFQPFRRTLHERYVRNKRNVLPLSTYRTQSRSQNNCESNYYLNGYIVNILP